MKNLGRLGLIGLGVAGLVALASALYLRESHQAVQRIVNAVDLSAPDLFPAQALVYVEMSGWDKSYARAEEWWKRFETTATHHALRQSWDREKLGLPPHVVEMIDRADRELGRAEEKYGYRPTTRQFWEAFGRHVAIGLLPAPKGERPRVLLATRLPDPAPAALQAQLSKAGGVKPCEPPMHQGFPMFQEPVGESGITVYYGVGRGYFFVSESLPELKGALERLAVSTDKGEKPSGTLAGDPALARVRPPAGKAESAVLYLRRDLKFADWEPELGVVDDFIRHAFVLAPKDESVAFSLPDGPDGEVRCSFDAAAPRPWTKSLPQGLAYLQASLPSNPADLKRHLEKEASAFFDKPLWKELDAFLSDPQRIKAFIEEAVPAEERPPDELLARAPNDIRFIGAALKEWSTSAINLPFPQFAMASKFFPGTDGAFIPGTAFGLDADPMAVFLLAGALDFVRTKWPEWLVREDKPGVISWTVDMKRVKQELPASGLDAFELYGGQFAPTLMICGRRVILVLGAEMAKDVVATQAGGPTFEEDPLYVEARGQVRPGYWYVSWDRPSERLRATWPTWFEWLETQLGGMPLEDGGTEVLQAGLKAVRKAVGWAKPHRAVLGVLYHDSARPAESAELIDVEAEKSVPVMVPPDAPARSIGFLPRDAWLYYMQRIELKPSWDELKKTFLEALPGGKEREEIELSGEAKEIVDAIVEGLIRNLKGEVGFAVIKPTPKPEDAGPPGVETFLARMPAFVGFAEFEKPVEAFQAVRKLMEKLHHAVEGGDPDERKFEFEGGPIEGDAQLDFKVGMIGEYRAATLDVIVSGDEPFVLSFCVVERGNFLFFTTSGDVLKRFGSAKEREADSLHARLPAGAAPEKVSSLWLWHGDTLVAQVRLYLELLLPAAPQLTLRGYPEGPPMERVEAHTQGWTRWMDLVLDLFRTRSWSVSSTSRTGAVIKSANVVVPEK